MTDFCPADCRLPKTLLLGILGILLLTTPGEAQSMSEYTHSHNVTLGAEETGNVTVGGNVVLNGTTVDGHVLAGRGVDARQCTILGNLSAGRDVTLEGCHSVMSLFAGRSATLANSTIQKDVQAGRNLSLEDVVIHGNAEAGHNVTLNSATIDGTLSTATPLLILSRSTLNHIRFQVPRGSVSISGNGVIMGAGSVVSGNGVSITSMEGRTQVRIGNSGTSSINGYTIKGASGQTTVMTPDNSLYVNGSKVHGDSPETYAQYQEQHPEAPHVVGPGWIATGSSGDLPALPEPDQILELRDHSVVNGDITFEGGHGKIIVTAGSRFLGEVHGGTVENQ
jgi:hypothetical protein